MAADQQFCLRWNNHQSTLISVFDTLLESGTLVDCTLAAEGQYLKAHKVVLSACSPYLEVLLSQHYEKHPIVILKDVKFQELKSMMDYMYRGEVNISQDQLGTFLKAAESLQIKGLSDSGGGDSDARDVGSTKTQRHDPPPPPPQNPRKTLSAPQPRSPAVLPHSSGLTIEPRRTAPHLQPHLADIPDSPPVNTPILRSREGSVSPSLRKRRRTRRSSQGDDSNLPSDSQLETSNSCDLPSQSTPLVSGSVPNIPATMTPIVPSPAPSLKTMDNEHSLETDHLNRLGMANLNSSVVESGLIKEKIEPSSEILLEPKTEYLDEMNNEDSVEDLTLDDDDDMDGSMDMSRPGPSHATDGSSQQGFAPWHMSGDRSTDEVFMAAQEAVGAHRDSQDDQWFKPSIYDLEVAMSKGMKRFRCMFCGKTYCNFSYLKEHQASTCDGGLNSSRKPYKCDKCNRAYLQKATLIRHQKFECDIQPAKCKFPTSGKPFQCGTCLRRYRRKDSLQKHLKFECDKEPQFECIMCNKRFKQSSNLLSHMRKKHGADAMNYHGDSSVLEVDRPQEDLTISDFAKPHESLTTSDIKVEQGAVASTSSMYSDTVFKSGFDYETGMTGGMSITIKTNPDP